MGNEDLLPTEVRTVDEGLLQNEGALYTKTYIDEGVHWTKTYDRRRRTLHEGVLR